MFLSLKSPIDPGNSEKTWMSLKCTLIWMERGLININGCALFALKTCHLAFMSTDKGRTAPILRRMRESFMKVRLLCHIYLLSSSTRHGISVVCIFYLFFLMKAWFRPLFHFLGAIFGWKLIFDMWISLSSFYRLWFFWSIWRGLFANGHFKWGRILIQYVIEKKWTVGPL